MRKRIVYTAHDGTVWVARVTEDCLSWLSCGGYWDGKDIDLEQQVERQVAAGHREHAVRRYMRAMDRGGCTTAEAFEIIRDRDYSHRGSGFELWAQEDLPGRWFRDAWRRSHNGGPIDIDMRAARRIQLERIKGAVQRVNKPRIALGRSPIVPQWLTLGNAIRRARDADELRKVWPSGVPMRLEPNPVAPIGAKPGQEQPHQRQIQSRT